MERNKPVVFVSSTCYDLKQIREDIKNFIEDNYSFEAMLSEFDSFPVSPCVGTFENCLNNVDKYADIFILIIGTTYGHVTDAGKSITNLEYLHAKAKGIPIYVFISSKLRDNLPLWKANPTGDFSSIVDNQKIFEFVSEIYDESEQWVYTYNSFRDIRMVLTNQLRQIFSDGLKYANIISKSQYPILQGDISADARRMIIEQPYAWEHKFYACVLHDEFRKMKSQRWNFKYGLYEGQPVKLNNQQFLDSLTEKITEIVKLTGLLGVLINCVIHDALGEPGTSSDLEMIVYVCKKFASIYERLIEWSLYLKTLQVNSNFDHLLELLYNLPKATLDAIDSYVETTYKEIISIPDTYDNTPRKISLTLVLDASNTDEINIEVERLKSILLD